MVSDQKLHELIIWSADMPSVEELLAMLDKMPKLKCVKIDRLFVEHHGAGIIRRLTEDRGIKVFYDAKYVEIPSKLEELAQRGCSYEPWMLNCMAGSVSTGFLEHPKKDKIDGLKRFADVCHSAEVRPCAVTVLTSKSDDITKGEFNGRGRGQQVLYYAEKLLECGFTDVVCSPNEAQLIRSEERFDGLDLNTPGVRLAGSSSDDQANPTTPYEAFQAGVDRIVSGRDLTKSEDPADNLDQMVAEAAQAMEAV